jgi:hypothetical protein
MYCLGLCKYTVMTFAQRRNRLKTHLSERIAVVKRRLSVCTQDEISKGLSSVLVVKCEN